MVWKLFQQNKRPLSLAIIVSSVGLAGCATVVEEDRYARLYDACDKRADVCYSKCSGYSYEEDRIACQSDCSYEADRCFADINRLAATESAYYSSSAYYGRYGSWYPNRGYRYGDRRYGYGRGYDRTRPRDDRREDRDEDTVPVERSTGKPNIPNPRTQPKVPRGDERDRSRPRPTTRPTGKPNTPAKPVTPTSRPTPKPDVPKASPPKQSSPKPQTPSKPKAPKPAPSKPEPKPSSGSKKPTYER